MHRPHTAAVSCPVRQVSTAHRASRRCLALFTAAVCAAALLPSCARHDERMVAGRILDAKTGAPVAGASVRTGTDSTRTSTGGLFVLERISGGDTLVAMKRGYIAARMVVNIPAGSPERIMRDMWMEPVMDTAWTSEGPVDASAFLENSRLGRKKLSINEARQLVVQLLPGARIRKGQLVKVNEREEWMFEFSIGHADGAVYMNAFSGEIRSAESEDQLLDRRLQDMLREREPQ